ncbi:MAG TPA: GNAT family protein [Bacteroidales bacterium]|nr:GNAT family protein [Bacteroidales bacterium]HRZ48994.1 GNAT family protein [Bacteroidales bacterium]
MKLRLRAPEFDDIPVIYLWENDPEVQIFSLVRTPVSIYAIEQYILSSDQDPFVAKQVRFMAETRENPVPVGHIDLFDIDARHRRAGVGILTDKAHRSTGYATEMLGLITHWCRQELELHQLWCKISASNARSIKLFSRAGFVETGRKREWLREEGNWVDEVFMQKLLGG